MNGISNINTSNSQIAFSGKFSHQVKCFIPKVLDRLLNPRDLTRLDRLNDFSRGMRKAEELNEAKNSKLAAEIIKEAAYYQNFDFLRGLNKTLDKDLAKKAYKNI